MKKLLLFTLAYISLISNCISLSAEQTKNYQIQTTLASSLEDNFEFSLDQKVEFCCTYNEISPIDQRPEKITLTFTRIQGSSKYNDESHSFDTEQKDSNALEVQSLSHLLYQPITVYLSKDFTIKKSFEQFERLLHLASLENSYIHVDFLQQIADALLFSLSHNQKDSSLTLYYPFKTDIALSPIKKENSLTLNQPLEIEALFSTKKTPFPIHLKGQLEGKTKWKKDSFFTTDFWIKHSLKEESKETLFEKPLSFDYEIYLQEIKPTK